MTSQGVTVSVVQKVGGVLLSLVLVRILTREDYGSFGVASAVVLFLMTFSVQRFAENAFFTKEGEDPRFDLHLGFALILHSAISILILAAAAAAAISPVYRPAVPLLIFGSIAPLLNAPRIIYSVSLTRDLDWRRIRRLSLFSFLFASLATIALAFAGFGAFALMAQTALVPIPILIDMAINRPDLFKVSFDLKSYRSSLHFGAFRSAGMAVEQGRSLCENLLIAGTLGVATLGVYGRALGLAQLSTGWLGAQFSAIAYPMLAKLEKASVEYRRAAGLLFRFCLWTAVAPAFAIAFASHAAISVLFGDRWLDAEPYVQPATLLMLGITIVGALNVIALVAVGSRFVFLNQTAFFLIACLGLIVALPFSLVAYAWFLAIGIVLLAVGVVARLLRVNALEFWDVFRASLPVAVVAVGMVLLRFGYWPAAALALPRWFELVAASSLSALMLLIAVRLLDPKGLAEVIRFTPAPFERIASAVMVLPRKGPAPAAP